MKDIEYKKGDVIESAINYVKEHNRQVIIAHCCNNEKKWGAGFVLALSSKWKSPERCFRTPADELKLGEVQFVVVEKNIQVANMIGQDGVGYKNGRPPIRYEAIDACLVDVCRMAQACDAIVFCPKFGAGLAGGTWDRIETLIIKNLCVNDISVRVYEL